MRRNTFPLVRKVEVGLFAAATTGTLFGSACSMEDVRQNILGGTLSFVNSYTADLWEALVPPAEKLFSTGGDQE
jgi:hypothetical protein